MKRHLFLLLAVFTLPSLDAAVAITLQQPQYGFTAIPSEQRRYFATVTGGTLNTITWTTSGGTISGSPASGWADVTAPSSGSSCSYSGTAPNYVVASATSFTLTATSGDDNTKSSTITVNVCNPSVSVNVVPGYRVLYSTQKALLQSFILGAINKSVTWSITTQPSGGNGSLADTGNRDTLFSATVAGRYVVTGTSVADGTKTATAMLYVTGNAKPYTTTPNKTEPIDCTADPSSGGTVYDVGPARSYTSVGAVPTLVAGDTLRIHNDDLTGSSPTTYHEYFLVRAQGTQSSPVRVVGCPDSLGNLPILDGSNATATTASLPSQALLGLAGIGIHFNTYATYGTPNSLPAYVSIEGLKLQNFNDTQYYYAPGAGSTTQWGGGAAFVSAIRLQDGYFLSMIGNEVFASGLAVFSEARTPEGQISRWVLVEGNYLHGNVKGINSGQTGGTHTLYLQAFGEVVQGNYAGDADATAIGGDFKDRGAWGFVRYNTFAGGNDTTARTIDYVDQQDGPAYTSTEQYLKNQGVVGDTVPLDTLAAWYEAWHSINFFYGNIVTSTVGGPVHFNSDHDTSFGGVPRYGALWAWANTGYLKPSVNYSSGWFDGGNPNLGAQMPEFPQFKSYNNIIWQDGTSTILNPYLTVVRNRDAFLDSSGTAIPSTCCTNDQNNGGFGSGWPPSGQATNLFYTGVDSLSTHLTGFGVSGSTIANTLSSRPFDTSTYVPVSSGAAGTAVSLPSALNGLPIRFQPDPINGYIVARSNLSDIGALAFANPTLSITTASLPGGSRTAPYSQTVVATGGNGTNTWSISAGSLPAGLTINSSTGVISGTATGSVGTSSFTVAVSSGDGQNASAPLSITIGAPPPSTALRGVTLRGATVQ